MDVSDANFTRAIIACCIALFAFGLFIWFLKNTLERKNRKQREIDSRTIDHFQKSSFDGNIKVISKTGYLLFSFEDGTKYNFVSEDTGDTFLHAVVFVCPCGDKSPVLLISHKDSLTLDVIKGLNYQNENTICGADPF